MPETVRASQATVTAGSVPAGAPAATRRLRWHALLVTVPAGALLCSLAFDLLSRVADDQFVWAQGAYALIAIGLFGGAVAAVAGLTELVRLPRPSPAFDAARRHLLLVDAGLALFVVSFLVRHAQGPEEPMPWPGLVLSVVAAGLVGLAVVQGSARASAGPAQDS